MGEAIRAYAAKKAKGALERYDFTPGPLGPNRVEVAVQYCGICHSDLSMINNEWGMTTYPFVPGHEAIGKVVAVGKDVKTVKPGQTVGVGWFAGSCLHCRQCMSGDHNLCPTGEQTIIGRPGAFADRIQCQETWAIPLPAELDAARAGPLFCGGVTVFNPLIQFDVRPTDHMGVIGIGGLGHLALQFFRAWGCEVVAFTSSESKRDEALKLGAHRIINSRDKAQLAAAKGSLDMILNTTNAALNWDLYIDCLAPRGRLHTVGAVPSPIQLPVFPMIMGQKTFSASPLGSPVTTEKMLEFCARHGIATVTETFPMSKVNEALAHLEAGKARFRIVLVNDLSA